MADKDTKKPELSDAKEKQEKLDRDLQAGLYHGKLEDMRDLIKKGAQVNRPLMSYAPDDEDDFKRKRREAMGRVHPIHMAARAGRGDLVELFIENGADVNTPKFKGSGPLHYAATSGKPEPGLVLLEHGADPNNVDDEGTTPLMDAIATNNEKLFDALLPVTKKLDQQENTAPWHSETPEYNGATAIIRAAMRGRVDWVERLHEHGADLTLAGREGRTVLHNAALHKNVPLVKYVLQHAPELINRQDENGDTPLHKTITMRSDECTDLLLEAGADVNIANKKGNPPLLHAAFCDHVHALKKLAPMVDDIHITNADKRNAVHICAVGGRGGALPLLAKLGLSTDAPDAGGKTPVMLAAGARNPGALYALIRMGKNVNQATGDGYSPMLAAIKAGMGRNIALLAEHGASIYRPLYKGTAPIEFARDAESRQKQKQIFSFARSEQTKRLRGRLNRRKHRAPAKPQP